MKPLPRLAVLAALALAACQQEPAADPSAESAGDAAAPASAPAPQRPAEAQVREGLWRTVMTVEGQTIESRACMDAASSPLATSSAEATVGDCEHSITPSGDGWSFTSTCAMPTGGRTTTEGTLTGDLQSRYRVQATTVTEGAPIASMNRTTEVVTEATHEGSCPEGWSPGDVEIAGLGRMNLGDMQRRAEDMAER